MTMELDALHAGQPMRDTLEPTTDSTPAPAEPIPFKPETWPVDADGFTPDLCTECGTPVRYGSRHSDCGRVAAARAPTSTGPNRAFALLLLSEACKSGHAGTIRLAAQLAGVPACDACGYVVQHCRCAGATPAAAAEIAQPAAPEPAAKRWPFVESPGFFAARLEAALSEFDGNVLPAVRNVLIENPPVIDALATQAQPATHAEVLTDAQMEEAEIMSLVTECVYAAQALVQPGSIEDHDRRATRVMAADHALRYRLHQALRASAPSVQVVPLTNDQLDAASTSEGGNLDLRRSFRAGALWAEEHYRAALAQASALPAAQPITAGESMLHYEGLVKLLVALGLGHAGGTVLRHQIDEARERIYKLKREAQPAAQQPAAHEEFGSVPMHDDGRIDADGWLADGDEPADLADGWRLVDARRVLLLSPTRGAQQPAVEPAAPISGERP